MKAFTAAHLGCHVSILQQALPSFSSPTMQQGISSNMQHTAGNGIPWLPCQGPAASVTQLQFTTHAAWHL
jgi:hypothetical protein